MGRIRETGKAEDEFAFRTPPLHNVTRTGPWMHDGAFNTLEAVILHHLDPASSLRQYDPGTQLPPKLQSTYQGDEVTCASNPCPLFLQPFVDALPIPAVAQPIAGSPGGPAHYVLAMTEFQQQLHRDLPATTVWGYGGTFPGPTIEAGRDFPVTVRWVNDLRDLSTGTLRTSHFLSW